MADGLWLIDGPPAQGTRLRLPTRAVVVRLSDGTLWLYAPTRLTPELCDSLDALGTLAHIVAPAPSRLDTLPDWLEHYPKARFWAAPGVMERAAQLSIPLRKPRALDRKDAGADWREDLHQLLVQGHPDHAEAVFFHRSSDTLIVCDLISAVETAHLSAWMRPVIWLLGLDDAVGRMPRWLRRGVRDEMALADSVERMIGWGPRRIILSQGRWYRRDGVAELERAFRHILRDRQWEKALRQMDSGSR
ncbi:MAG: DUF4336 domain-containing protein [Pseudomonadota bacterium]